VQGCGELGRRLVPVSGSRAASILLTRSSASGAAAARRRPMIWSTTSSRVARALVARRLAAVGQDRGQRTGDTIR
jgi:hypothetical protein